MGSFNINLDLFLVNKQLMNYIMQFIKIKYTKNDFFFIPHGRGVDINSFDFQFSN